MQSRFMQNRRFPFVVSLVLATAACGDDAGSAREADDVRGGPRDGAGRSDDLDGGRDDDGPDVRGNTDASVEADAHAPDDAPSTRGGFYNLERLDRGLVAVPVEGGMYLGWRLFGDEYAEGSELAFRVLRNGEQIATVADSTNYFDDKGTADDDYRVAPMRVSAAGKPSEPALRAEPGGYLRVPLSAPPAGTTPGSPTCEQPNERYTYTANDASTGDLDGDGRYELVLKWDPSNAKDNSQSGCTGPVYLDAYELDGERLWRLELGPNIRAGAHYTQFVVADLDGDGRAEVVLKTAPGTRDASGDFLSKGPAAADDDRVDYRSRSNAGGRTGYVLTGPEYLTVFDGKSGRELATVDYLPGRGTVKSWGDDYGNRVDRFLAGAAFLDDTGLPSVVMARGYYTRTTLTAWNYRDGVLRQLWRFDSNDTPRDARGKPFSGQGAHSLSIANVDDDPQQEILYGAMAVDHDGRGLCSTGFGHGDALHVGDLVPSRPGLEVFMPHEDTSQPSYDLRDARTCEVLVQGAVTGKDTGRGVAADISSASEGAELWVSGTELLDARGNRAGATPSSANFLVYWDADPLRELLDAATVSKYGGGALLRCDACSANNGTKSTPALVADLFGDHREEIVWRETDGAALRIYTTTTLSRTQMYTLMHDAQYRAAVAFQNVGYNQPAHASFALGAGNAPKPSLR